jgi:hypothetical protein
MAGPRDRKLHEDSDSDDELTNFDKSAAKKIAFTDEDNGYGLFDIEETGESSRNGSSLNVDAMFAALTINNQSAKPAQQDRSSATTAVSSTSSSEASDSPASAASSELGSQGERSATSSASSAASSQEGGSPACAISSGSGAQSASPATSVASDSSAGISTGPTTQQTEKKRQRDGNEEASTVPEKGRKLPFYYDFGKQFMFNHGASGSPTKKKGKKRPALSTVTNKIAKATGPK